MSLSSWLNKFEQNQVFTEEEAWMLFKITAYGEAIGWTILIIGIVITKFITPNSNVALLLAGRIHGLLFIVYGLSSILLYPSLKWSKRKSFTALLASVPPYGSLVFEKWASYIRKNSDFTSLYSCILLTLAISTTE